MTPLPTQFDETIEETMERAKLGDGPARGRFLLACRPYLLRLAQQREDLILTRNERDSDLFQETFLNVMKEIDTFEGCTPRQLYAWLRVIFDRTTIELWRRLHTKKRDIRRETSIDARNFQESLRNAAPSAAEVAVMCERIQLVRDMLPRLPMAYAKVLLLRAEGSSYGEIGQLMGLSADVARKLYERALRKFGKQMKGLK